MSILMSITPKKIKCRLRTPPPLTPQTHLTILALLLILRTLRDLIIMERRYYAPTLFLFLMFIYPGMELFTV